MKFLNVSILSLGIAIGVRAAPAIQPAAAQQPAPTCPIGTRGGSNAKVAGRLFDIDGRVEYFAGITIIRANTVATNWYKVPTPGGSHI